jgi:hypothetical protein
MAIKTYSVERDGETFLSPHFQVKEFRPRWHGVPDGDIVKIDDELIERLELLSDCVNNAPIHISDGYRTERFDIALTGKAGQHTTGRAADIYVNGVTSEALCVLAEACGFRGIGTINSKCIHVDTRESNRVVCFRENGTKAGSETVITSFFNQAKWLHPVIVPKSKIESIEFVETREAVKVTAQKFNDVDYIINGGFFCTFKEPQFWLKINGIIRHNYNNHLYGIGLINPRELSYGVVNGVDNFISGHPVLMDAGRFTDYSYALECDGWTQRSAIGYAKNGDVILLAVDKKGLTLRGLRQVMAHLGSYYAINLDGGGSTSLYNKGKCLNEQTDQRAVNNVIMIRCKG